MPLGNDASINSALRRLERLSSLDDQQLTKLAHAADMRRVPPGSCVLELGSEDTRLLFLLKGELKMVAEDGAVRLVRHTDTAALGPVSRLRPSRYRVTARTEADCLMVEQNLLDSYSDQRTANSVLVADSYLVSEPTELIDDSASHPMMFDVFHDLNHGRMVVPSDPDIVIRVGNSLGRLGTDTARLAGILSICPALTLKVMRAAKAAQPDRVALHSSKQAVEQLGAEQAHALAINCVLRESLRTSSKVVRERMRDWWERTMRISAICAVLARVSARFDPEYAALIGLMHAIAEPVLLSYADRHQDLADSAALDNVVHDNRAELGRILLSMWGLPREIVEAAARCNQWSYSGATVADYTDILLVAEWHATIGGVTSRRKPAIEEIPAFRRLGLESCGPELGFKIVEAADQVMEKIETVLVA